MRQFTTPEQTAKLIDLGFAKPKSRVDGEMGEILKVIVSFGEFEMPISNNYPAYSIGELIEILPPIIEHEIWWGDELGEIGVWGLRIDSGGTADGWDVSYERPNSAHAYLVGRGEMVDALFDMIVTLKEDKIL